MRFLLLVFLSAVLIPYSSVAQVIEENPSCFRLLHCEENYSSALNCLRDRSSSAGRDCKHALLPNADEGGKVLAQFPFVILLVILIIGMYRIEPLKNWLKGIVIGTMLGAVFLLLEVSSFQLTHNYLEHLTFPTNGLMSFSPNVMVYLPFAVEFLLANIVLYAGVYGFVRWQHKYANLCAVLYALSAVALSVYDAALI